MLKRIELKLTNWIDPSVIKPGAGREAGEKVEGKKTGTLRSAINYVADEMVC